MDLPSSILSLLCALFTWGRGWDLNPRPTGYEIYSFRPLDWTNWSSWTDLAVYLG
jgi:hypothetical protein